MLKVFLGFLVSVVGLLLSSAYVSPTYAASASVLMTHIQAGAVGAATQEFIVLYNNSPDDVDISDWCLTNKNNAVITCFNSPAGQKMYIPPYAHAVAASSSLSMILPIGTVTSTYTPFSQSSGSLIGSGDTVSLLDNMGYVVDRHAWTTSLSAGMQFERHGIGSPVIYQDTDMSADWSVTLPGILAVDETYIDTTIVDACPNIEGVQPSVPIGKERDIMGECVDSSIPPLMLTEILPNPAGGDEGHEFIELYNPNDVAIDLVDYRLLIGPNDENMYSFPSESSMQPGSYMSFSNSAIPFTLLNSSSHVVLTFWTGIIVSEAPRYIDPKDDQSWAVIDDVWQYVSHSTPGVVNVIMSDDPVEVLVPSLMIQPCAANQYRSPDTNRCRLLSTSSSTVTPCKDGQYRSEETNRCRNIASEAATITPCQADQERNLGTNRCRNSVAATDPAACKEGQERNPDTNRCRTITKMPDAGYGVLGAETKNNGNWYVLAAVGGVTLLALGYAIWEWHDELAKFFRKLASRVGQFARMRK